MAFFQRKKTTPPEQPEPTGRTIAIGDTHGCARALNAVLDACQPGPDDIVVTLGDYVDRGDDSPGVLDRLIRLKEETQLYPVLGNHDEMLLEIADGALWKMTPWLTFGGLQTLEAYGVRSPANIPAEHLEFLRSCIAWTESDTHFFVHANYLPHKPLKRHTPDTLRWESLEARMPGPHRNGKRAVLGHTSQKDGEILQLDQLVCIDTYCYGGGRLTAYDIHSEETWQADINGKMR